MKITYDKVAPGYTHPLSAKAVRQLIQQEMPAEIRDRIVRIRFGCNQKTTQEGRIVGRGDAYEVRINFCPLHSKTRLLSKRPYWTSIVEALGGVLEEEKREVMWSTDAARRYAIFLLFHELAHALYAARNSSGNMSSFKTSSPEEKWCDSFALESARRLAPPA